MDRVAAVCAAIKRSITIFFFAYTIKISIVWKTSSFIRVVLSCSRTSYSYWPLQHDETEPPSWWSWHRWCGWWRWQYLCYSLFGLLRVEAWSESSTSSSWNGRDVVSLEGSKSNEGPIVLLNLQDDNDHDQRGNRVWSPPLVRTKSVRSLLSGLLSHACGRDGHLVGEESTNWTGSESWVRNISFFFILCIPVVCI